MDSLLCAVLDPGLATAVQQVPFGQELAASPGKAAQAFAACIWGLREHSRRLQDALSYRGMAQVRELTLC